MKNILDKSQLNDSYILIPKELIESEFLSCEAKWVYCYFRAQPDEWYFYPEDVLSCSDLDEKAFNKACKELTDIGWMIIEKDEQNPNVNLSYRLVGPNE